MTYEKVYILNVAINTHPHNIRAMQVTFTKQRSCRVCTIRFNQIRIDTLRLYKERGVT